MEELLKTSAASGDDHTSSSSRSSKVALRSKAHIAPVANGSGADLRAGSALLKEGSAVLDKKYE